MRLHLALAVAATSALVGCGEPVAEVCGLSTTAPTADDVPDGRGVATRSDGGSFSEAGTWSPGADIVLGTLSFLGNFDEEGLAVDGLISAGTFPICQRLGARDEKTSQADFVGENVRTDATHVGALSILGLEDGVLVGRFEAELVSPDGATTLTLSDGAFRVPQR
jgi:hypothetical protein